MTAADLSKRFETAAARDNLQDETFLSLLQKLPSNAKTLLLRLSSPEYLSMSTTTMDIHFRRRLNDYSNSHSRYLSLKTQIVDYNLLLN